MITFDGEFKYHFPHDIGFGIVVYPPTTIAKGVTIAPNACLGRPTANTGIRRAPDRFAGKPTEIMEGCHIGHAATVYQGAVIGPRCMICDGARIGPGVELGAGCMVAQNTTINRGAVIGAGTRIMDLVHIAGDMVVGEHCFVGMGVTFANDSSMGTAMDPQSRPPVLENHVRVGTGARILAGVRLGEGCVIAAGAVMTKDARPYAVYMGVPARRVRSLP